MDASEGLPKTGEWRTHPALGDVNNDGNLDVAGMPRKGLGPAVFLGDGAGGWEEASTGLRIPGFSCGVGVDLADVDGDGLLDLGAADHCSGTFLFMGTEETFWRMSGSKAVARAEGGVDDIRFADVNGDGHIDAVVSGAFKGGVDVLLGDGTGDFREGDLGLSETGFGPDVKVGDINGDGQLDIASTLTGIRHSPYRPDNRRLPIIWLSDPTGRYRSRSNGLPDDGDFRGVALGDVNRDGMTDLVISAGRWQDRSPLLVYLGNGGFSWLEQPAPGSIPPDTVYEGVELTDLDGDGALDILAVDYRNAGLHSFLGDGKGGFERCLEDGLPEYGGEDVDWRGWGLAIGDVNKDGKPDVAAGFGKAQKGRLDVWLQH